MMRFLRERRWTALCSVLAVLVNVGAVWPVTALADSTPPQATKMVLHDNTTSNNYDPPGGVAIPTSHTFTITGTTYDTNTTAVVRTVVTGIQNLDTLAWLQGDGSWTTGYKRFAVRVPA